MITKFLSPKLLLFSVQFEIFIFFSPLINCDLVKQRPLSLIINHLINIQKHTPTSCSSAMGQAGVILICDL